MYEEYGIRAAMALAKVRASSGAGKQQSGQLTMDAGVETGEAGAYADDYASQYIALQAASAVVEFSETVVPDDLGDGESLADRMNALLVGIADADQNGELDDNEKMIVGEATNAAADFMLSAGVSEGDVIALLSAGDAAAAERIHALLAEVLPADDDGMAMVDDFVFGPEAEEGTFDSGVMKKAVVFRDGKKQIERQHVGPVRQSAEQRVANRKMQAKSHSAAAQAKRKRSMAARNRAGM